MPTIKKNVKANGKKPNKKPVKKKSMSKKDREEILALFKKYDTDKNGTLDQKEVRMAMKEMYAFTAYMGIPFTDQDIEKMIQNADENKDGKIEIDEFVNLI